MNRRNLFQACAAGLAWLAGGKLPSASGNEAKKPLLQKLRDHGRLDFNSNGQVTARVWNAGPYPIKSGCLAVWNNKPRHQVRLADLSLAEIAGVALEDSRPGEPLRILINGRCHVATTR